jgi:biotin transport system substrate-specific component
MNSKAINKVSLALNHEIVVSKTLQKTLSVSVFIMLTTFGAYVRLPLPFTPVPITLQTLFVMLSGIFLGANLAGISLLSYLMLGYLGMPLFAGAASGSAVLIGPTGGYFIGFILCGYTVGHLIRLRDNTGWVIFILSCGSLVILIMGTAWLSLIMNLSLKRAALLGFLPFLPGDLLKVLAVTLFYKNYAHKFKGFQKG